MAKKKFIKKKIKMSKYKKASQKKTAKLRKLLPMLQSLKNTTPKNRGVLLTHLDNNSRNGLYETVHNVLKNPLVPPTTRGKLKRKLYPYKKDLRYIADGSHSSKSRQQRLARMGGFPWETILSTAIPLLMAAL